MIDNEVRRDAASVRAASQQTLGLVIPVWKEAASLPGLLSEVSAVLSVAGIPFEVLVVDDDSRDGTAELVAAMAREDPRIRLLVRRKQRGLAGAILYGWEQTNATLLGAMDADLQHPPALLLELLEEMARGHDVALASRYVRGAAMQEWNPIRRLISSAAISMTIPLQRRGVRVKDPMSGYFLVRRECIQNLSCQPEGFKLLLEILVRGRIASVSEVPFVFGRRNEGRSKASLGVAWEYLRLLAALYRWRWKTAVTDGLAGDEERACSA